MYPCAQGERRLTTCFPAPIEGTETSAFLPDQTADLDAHLLRQSVRRCQRVKWRVRPTHSAALPLPKAPAYHLQGAYSHEGRRGRRSQSHPTHRGGHSMLLSHLAPSTSK